MLYTCTGGTGFLGSHLVTKLVQDGHHVRILARNPPRNAADLPPQVEFIQGSVTDPHAVLRATDGAAGIFHLSGVVEHSRRNDDAITATHVDGTRNVLEAAERSRARVVYASTSGTVAVSTDPMSRPGDDAPYAEAVTAPWPYYRSKIEAERAARRLAEEKGVELICMRPSLLLGPGDARLSSTRTVFDLMRGKIPILPPGGLSFIDVRDAADAFAAAMAHGTPGGSYLLGGPNWTFEEYFQTIAELSGTSAPRLRVPVALARGLAAAASSALSLVGAWDPSLDPVVVEMSAAYWYLDAQRARAELGLAPRDARATLGDTIRWIRAHEAELAKL